METPKQVTHAEISIELLNRTLNYLATKPFQEVFELIAALKTTADASVAEQNRPPSTVQ